MSHRPKVTLLVGAAGGDGTTAATILAAVAARDSGERVTVIDPRGDVAVLAGIPPDRRRGLSATSLRLRHCALDDDQAASLGEAAEGIVVLSHDADAAQIATGDRVGAAGPWLDGIVVARAGTGDMILIDAGTAVDAAASGWLQLAEPADRVLVASNRPASIVRAGELLRSGVARRSLLMLDSRFSASTAQVCAAWGRRPDAVLAVSEDLIRAAELGTLLNGPQLGGAAPLQPIVGRARSQRVSGARGAAGLG